MNASTKSFPYTAARATVLLSAALALLSFSAPAAPEKPGARPVFTPGAAVKPGADAAGTVVNPGAVATTPAPCCSITAINAATGLVTARANATGQTFQFSVNDTALRKTLRADQAIYADFDTQNVSLDGVRPCGRIVQVAVKAPVGVGVAGPRPGTIPTAPVAAPRPGTIPTAPVAGPTPNRYRIVSIQTPAPGVIGGVKPPLVGTGPTTGISPGGGQACTSPTTTSTAFLKIDGIEGESQDLCHKGEIELLSMQTGSSIPQTGGGVSSLPASNFTVAKRIDKASPKLLVAVASGEHHVRATITLLSGGAQPQWLIYTLTDVLVTSLSQSVGLETREEVVLNARELKLETKIQVGSVSLQPSPSTSAVDLFLKLDGIPGDSQDPAHKGEIVVLSFKDGVQITAASSTSGGTPGKAHFLDFVIDKNIDTASPHLLMTYQTGKHVKEAVITLRRKSGADLLVYKLADVLITAYSQVAGATQRERVSLNFTKIELLLGTGPNGPGPRGGWDLTGNKRI